MLEQLARVPRIFRRDQIHLAQDPHSPWGHVFKIPDGSCYKIKGAHEMIAAYPQTQHKYNEAMYFSEYMAPVDSLQQ
jgi:hypothetical protein